MTLLASLRQQMPNERLKQRLAQQSRETGVPLYSADPDDPSKLVEIDPDGQRTSSRVAEDKSTAYESEDA